ncbi:FtsX-like permease family protein [Candidatus Falkowbacteria bacterium]|nr:FtsX-like permease family protein [Candidatus Falkowbacteria bacterium]
MISLIRALKFSFQDIFRNVWLSIVTVTILALALFSMNALFTVKLISENAVEAVKERINVSLYFKPDASDAQILETQKRVEDLAGVKEVKFISKAEALENFRNKNQNNSEILNALKEIGKNPLSPSLIITPADFNNFQALITSLKALESEALESRDFSDNSVILEKINQITYKVNEIGLILIAIFILIGLLVAYNAIRVAIYTHRQEIEIMRLVGASNFFIYMPYVFSAFFYAIVATLIMAVSLFPLLSILQPYLEVFFTGYNVNITSFYADNAWAVFGVQFASIFVVTLIATWLAVRKYARV